MNIKNRIFNSSCEDMSDIPDKSVNCCVTSPPYFALRDYGVEGQIGLESTPDEYVKRIVQVFREVKRVLRDDGTVFLNLGDSYASIGGGYSDDGSRGKSAIISPKTQSAVLKGRNREGYDGIKPKDLIGIPWMVAFALRADGWYLRQDIIWHKPNPMPESVRDRCTKSHEYIFLLSKSQKYYFDQESIKEESVTCDDIVRDRETTKLNNTPGRTKMSGLVNNNYEKRNKRSVWSVTTKPCLDAHFATFPQDLIIDCIKAGCPEGGIVLDPFMGAGTTAIVSRKLGRNYVGYELNPDYIAIAEKRLNKEIGLFL